MKSWSTQELAEQAYLLEITLEMEVMKAENQQREHAGQSPAYAGDAFEKLLTKLQEAH
jgi:hypothetical protein